MNTITLDRQGTGTKIQFDPIIVQSIMDSGIINFEPVIIDYTTLENILPLLELKAPK